MRFLRVVLIILLPVALFMSTCGRPFLRQPSPLARKSARKIDYQTLEFIFRTKPLPESVKLTGVDYAGYSTIFNGPDGAVYSKYEITLNAADFERMRGNFEKNITSREPSNSAWNAVYAFDSDLREFYWEHLDTPREKEVTHFTLETRNSTEQKHPPLSTMVVDGRTSPTLKIYLSTRAYFYLPDAK